MKDNESWSLITKNRKLLHYLNKQNFRCIDCNHHFKTEDKINKSPYKYPKYPHIEHLNTLEINDFRPDNKQDVNRIMCSECHAKRHNYKYGWMKRFKK